MIFDWKAAHKGKVKNYKPKHKIVDFDLWPHNIRVKVCPTRRPQEPRCTFRSCVRESHSRFTTLARARSQGDVKIVFYDWDQFSAPDKMCHVWLNTGFVENNYLLFHKEVLDRACKDKACKEFEPEFKIEMFLDRVEDTEGEFESMRSEYLEADNDEDMADDD